MLPLLLPLITHAIANIIHLGHAALIYFVRGSCAEFYGDRCERCSGTVGGGFMSYCFLFTAAAISVRLPLKSKKKKKGGVSQSNCVTLFSLHAFFFVWTLPEKKNGAHPVGQSRRSLTKRRL